jgi:hypothetical protein
MDTHASAGIELCGSALRYAEVEHIGPSSRLLRLGSCEFDFDVSRDVLEKAVSAQADTLVRALSDVFQGSHSSRLNVVLHPPGCYSFFTTVPASLENADVEARVERDLALLTPAESPLRASIDRLGTRVNGNGDHEWVHVLAVPVHVHYRLDRLMRNLPQEEYRLITSMRSLAPAFAAQAEDGLALGIGWYRSHVEYTLSRDKSWYFSHFTTAGASVDTLYFAVDFLRRLGHGPKEIRTVLCYGDTVDHGAMRLIRRIFGTEPRQIDPLSLVVVDAVSSLDGFDGGLYAPCVGAALL